MGLKRLAQDAKHQLWLLTKEAAKVRDSGLRRYTKLVPFQYEPARYGLDFHVLKVPPLQESLQDVVPRRIFCSWTGDNELTSNRRAGLDSIRSTNPDCEVVLVTQENLHEWVLPEAPLHPSYVHLSFVHRKDYLQAYLLHHHGGGHTDIKRHPTPWRSGFEQINANPQAWLLGYPIGSLKEATRIYGPMGGAIHRHFASLPGTGGMIARAGSPLTHEWILELNRRMDYYSSLLELYPGNVWGDNEGYPVPWTKLGSQISEPLFMKYLSHIRLYPAIKSQLFDHR